MAVALRLPWLIGFVIVTSGTLGAPFLPDEVPFSAVEREHFDALAVSKERAEPDPAAPLVVRVSIVGDGADADLTVPLAWLETRAGIRVVEDPRGAPLFLTKGDLAATSGRGTLGATVPSGMAVEVADARVYPCVVAHEVLHFVGLRHVDDARNIMAPHCPKDHLDRAVLDGWQIAKVQEIERIQATTPSGVRVWAERS